MITTAILALNERDGSSRQAIDKYIQSQYSNLSTSHATVLTQQLRVMKARTMWYMSSSSWMLKIGRTFLHSYCILVRLLYLLAPIFSALLPTYQVSAANKQGTVVSRDPEALYKKYSDPLVYTGSIRVRTGYEILRLSSYLQQNLEKLSVSFLVLHGSADAVTDPQASQRLYK